MEKVLTKLWEMESAHERCFIENSITKHKLKGDNYHDLTKDLELIIEIRKAIEIITKAIKHEQ
jgi:hypothetical protein